MARNAYKSEKRRKETARLKKQEEKRQRRMAAKTRGSETDVEEAEMTGMEGIEGDRATEGDRESTGPDE